MCRRSRPIAAGAASGLVLGIAALPWEVGWTAALGLAPLLGFVSSGAGIREAAAAGFVCGLGWFGIAFAWVPFLDGGSWQTAALYLGYVPLLATSCTAFGAAVAALRRFGPPAQLAAAPGLWLALEEHQGLYLDAGVSWLRLGHAVAPWPSAIQLAALGGVGLVSAWLVAASAALVAGWRGGIARRVALAVLVALPLAAGAARLHAPASGEAIAVAALQPAVAQSEKFDPARFDARLRRLVALADDAVRAGAEVLVWPETAWERPLPPRGFDPFLAALTRDLGVVLVTGVRRRSADGGGAQRNAAVVIGEDGAVAGVVDKAFLVPVLEAAPVTAVARLLARHGLWPGRSVPGLPPRVVHVGGERPLALGVLVCFDVTQPALVRALRRAGARLLVQPANEALSGGWTAVSQARIARLRAVEAGAPLVRAANTGPSEWIDGRGVLVHALAASQPGAGRAALPLAGGPTPFVRFGDTPAWLAVAALFAAVALPSWRRPAAWRREVPLHALRSLHR